YNLCNYYNYTSTAYEYDTSSQKNDFSSWTELSGWTESNPSGATSLPTKSQVSEYPATFIRWWGARAYADFYGVKLPSEAQWEYAAKGGNNYTYAVYDGVTTSDANWNSSNLTVATHHVRKAKSGNANPYGLYNLGGNVWEWMEDNFVSFSSASAVDPILYDGSNKRAWRGGSWNYHQATLESSARYYDEETKGNDHFGFRVVR
ncbi:MAG: SUMF1/EgtB/PvdO family nonheme iron enzyme, partial [Leptospiraceae bacterium]|nr:SUMF1/EgtB/PvdO family nonheme iron enzyme [Leptospiraceae bacterium]